MATKSYIRRAPAPRTGHLVNVDSGSQTSVSSPRINGKLTLVPNPWTQSKDQVYGMMQGGNGKDLSYYPNPSSGVGAGQPDVSRARNAALLRARNRFRGKLYKGSAALGVTIGSYKQSREMIVARSTQIADSAALLASRASSDNSLRRRQSLSGSYLETVFGWQPLLSDIHASCMTVIQQADYLDFVRGRSQESFSGIHYFNPRSPDNYHGLVSVVISSQVRIANPNAWLLERAGLANPAAVAWDLVPWSFVVNMFVSTGALVNSITDFMGLEFKNESTTYRTRGVGDKFITNGLDPKNQNFAFASNQYSFQRASRIVGSIPRPPLMLKLPKANWELAAIAASLMVQKVKALDRILSVAPLTYKKRVFFRGS